jgi:hypothetical protein
MFYTKPNSSRIRIRVSHTQWYTMLHNLDRHISLTSSPSDLFKLLPSIRNLYRQALDEDQKQEATDLQNLLMLRIAVLEKHDKRIH